MEKATHYLTSQLPNVKSLYVRAIAAYALNVVDRNDHHAVSLYNALKKEAQNKGEM